MKLIQVCIFQIIIEKNDHGGKKVLLKRIKNKYNRNTPRSNKILDINSNTENV